jgi:hypothetical protein
MVNEDPAANVVGVAPLACKMSKALDVLMSSPPATVTPLNVLWLVVA